MTSKDLFLEIGNVDDDLVEQAANYRRQRPAFRPVLLRWVAAAACLLLIVGIGAYRFWLPSTQPVPQILPGVGIRGFDAPTPYSFRKILHYNGYRYAFLQNGAPFNLSEFDLTKELGVLEHDLMDGDGDGISANFALGAILYELPGYSPDFRIAAVLDGEYYVAELVGKADDTPMEASRFLEAADLASRTQQVDILSHWGDVLHTFDNRREARKMASALWDSQPATLTNEQYEALARAQSQGDSWQLAFRLDDGTTVAMYIIPSMKLISIGDNYYQLPDTLLQQYGPLITSLRQDAPPLA